MKVHFRSVSCFLNKVFHLVILLALFSPIQSSDAFAAEQSILTQAETSAGWLSAFPTRPPEIDGINSIGEWDSALSYDFLHGKLLFLNDYVNIYIFIDFLSDTHDDPIPDDFFWLSLDINQNGVIDPNIDIKFNFLPGTDTPCISRYLGPNSWGACVQADSTYKAGFAMTKYSSTPHRFFEIAISRAEISLSATLVPKPALPYIPNSAFFGLRLYSLVPALDYYLPASHTTDFSNLMPIALKSPEILLLVLSDEGFLNALEPLKSHKDYTALPTYVMSWQSITKAYGVWGRDDPERIKKAIAHHDQYAQTEFVILVGDADRFPMRYTTTDWKDDKELSDWAFYVTDLYYADLYEADGTTFEDWDANDDGYYGELHGSLLTGVVNFDQVEAKPDIAVGRVPASWGDEVVTFVNKVINYEYNAYKASWSKRALMLATTDFIYDACQTKDLVSSAYLSPLSYATPKLYQYPNPCLGTPLLSPANINAEVNTGVSFINYYGHGSTSSWAIAGDAYDSLDVNGLTNADMLNIAISGGCSTAKFTTEPPYEAYIDIFGVYHEGWGAGEIIEGKPPQPAPIQVVANTESLMEYMLLKTPNAAVGYVGFTTGSQSWGLYLDEYFYESLDYNAITLGDMWKYMIRRYYTVYPDPGVLTATDWFVVAGFHQPWKFSLFGDPSLRINGVSRYQKSDFQGPWAHNHDGWLGKLSFEIMEDNYLSSEPNLVGTYLPLSGGTRLAYGYVRTWNYPIPESLDRPDHLMEYYIDFNNTPSLRSDDQKFYGFLFTHDRSKMAGLTWWSGTPYGFYAVKSSDETSLSLAYEFPAAPAVYDRSVFLGDYRMNYDGLQGRLHLYAPAGTPVYPTPNILGTYVNSSGVSYDAYAYVRTSTYTLPLDWGPDHQIKIYIDFAKTPGSLIDDQQFLGYLFTQTQKAIAGATIATNFYGFFAEKIIPVYLPMTMR